MATFHITVPPQNYLPLEIFTLQKYLQPQELTLNMARPSFTIVKPTTEILTLQIYLHSQAGTHHVNNSVVALYHRIRYLGDFNCCINNTHRPCMHGYYSENHIRSNSCINPSNILHRMATN